MNFAFLSVVHAMTFLLQFSAKCRRFSFSPFSSSSSFFSPPPSLLTFFCSYLSMICVFFTAIYFSDTRFNRVFPSFNVRGHVVVTVSFRTLVSLLLFITVSVYKFILLVYLSSSVRLNFVGGDIPSLNI